MLPGLFFWFWRSFEIITLIPTLGMLSWFVHGYTESNVLTPSAVLVLFIVSVIACFWAVSTLLFYHGMTRWNAHFVAFIDLCLVGALIAGVYYLRDIKNWSCPSFGAGEPPAAPHGLWAALGIFGYYGAQHKIKWAADPTKNCAMLKASWAFGIMNIIMFFFTFLILLWVAREYPQGVGGRGTTRTVRRTSRRYSNSRRSPGRSSYHSTRRTYY